MFFGSIEIWLIGHKIFVHPKQSLFKLYKFFSLGLQLQKLQTQIHFNVQKNLFEFRIFSNS